MKDSYIVLTGGKYTVRDLELYIQQIRDNDTVDLMAVCEHGFKYAGHNHNWSVYQCTKCGKTEERAS